MKVLAFDGKHKIADKWSEDVFIVIEQPNTEIPIYKVRRENGSDVETFLLLHRNHLLHLGNSLQSKTENVQVKEKVSKQNDKQTNVKIEHLVSK